MKLPIIFLSFFILVSCSKEEIPPNPHSVPTSASTPGVLNIVVGTCSVSNDIYCDNPTPVISADIYLYETELQRELRVEHAYHTRTSFDGKARIAGLKESTYYVLVDCPYGEEESDEFTPPNSISFLEVFYPIP